MTRILFPLPLRLGAFAIVAVLLSGCGSLHTQLERPEVTLPSRWTGAAEPPAAVPVEAAETHFDGWWRVFGDPDLNHLIDVLLERNNDLAAAAIKVRRARLEAGLAADALVPTASLGADASLERELSDDRRTSRSGSVSGSLAYEVDLWGRLAGLRDQADWEATATEEDREATALSLVGTAIDLYWQLAYLNERLRLSEQSIAYAERVLQLVRVQHQAGGVSALEEQEARQSLASQRASHAELLQERTEDLNALAILFDSPPGERWANPFRLPEGDPPEIRPGIPAEVLARRPDVRAAEWRLRATLGAVDTTRASYYPRLSLTGSLGSSSDELSDLLRNPVATLGAGLVLPFVQATEMRLNVGIAEADYEQAVVEFRQTLYDALAEVENALSARRRSAEQAVQLEASLAAAREAERIYGVRYRAGSVALREWLDAQESRRSAQVSLAENRLARLTDQVTLYQALGGSDVPTSNVAASSVSER